LRGGGGPLLAALGELFKYTLRPLLRVRLLTSQEYLNALVFCTVGMLVLPLNHWLGFGSTFGGQPVLGYRHTTSSRKVNVTVGGLISRDKKRCCCCFIICCGISISNVQVTVYNVFINTVCTPLMIPVTLSKVNAGGRDGVIKKSVNENPAGSTKGTNSTYSFRNNRVLPYDTIKA